MLVFANEKPLLSLPKFPQRLGRMVANADNSDFYTHLDLDCLALQLSHLRQKFPNKKLKHQFIFIEEFVMFSEEKVGMKMLRKY